MELFFLSLPPLIVIFISLSLPFFIYKHKVGGAANLPPGKTGWPIIGETLEFISASMKGVPEKFIKDRMSMHSSEVFKTSLLGQSMAVLCSPKGHKFLFSNENKLVTAWWPHTFDKILLTSPQASSATEDSKDMRKLLPGFLKPEALQRYVSVMDSVAKQHLDIEWDNKEEVTVLPLSRKYTFSLACRLFLNIDDPDLEAKLAEPFSALCAGLTSIPIDLPGTRFNAAIKAAKFIRRAILEIIKQRKMDLAEKASPSQDLLSHMLLTSDENRQFMSEVGISEKILGLLIGGHDTAASTITFIMKYLAELPDIYKEVLKEQMEIAVSKAPEELLNWEDFQKMKYSWQVANEVMRLAPPAQGTFRMALDNFTYGGFSIPKGWKLYWSVHSTHKNPDYFPNPEKFDPSRFEGHGPAPYTFVPFGGGPRMCPGKEFARYEILAFMHNVVTRFKWEKLLQYEKTIMNLAPAPEKGLPIRIQSHKTMY